MHSQACLPASDPIPCSRQLPLLPSKCDSGQQESALKQEEATEHSTYLDEHIERQ